MTNDQRFHVGIGAILTSFITASVMAVFRQPFLPIVDEGFIWIVFSLYFGWLAMNDEGVKTRARYYSVAEEFTRFPEGRLLNDSGRSGEALRRIITPMLQEGALVLNLDGTMGYASSWLEGCFLNLEAEAPVDRLTIICEDPSIVQESWGYIKAQTTAATRRRLGNEETERRFPERR